MACEETSEEFQEKIRSIELRDKNRLCEKRTNETYGYVRGTQSLFNGYSSYSIKI